MTFDNVIEDKPVGEMNLFVGAKSVGRKVFVVRGAVDREGSAAMVEADDITLVNVFGITDRDPGVRFNRSHRFFLLEISVNAGHSAAASATGSGRRTYQLGSFTCLSTAGMISA